MIYFWIMWDIIKIIKYFFVRNYYKIFDSEHTFMFFSSSNLDLGGLYNTSNNRSFVYLGDGYIRLEK